MEVIIYFLPSFLSKQDYTWLFSVLNQSHMQKIHQWQITLLIFATVGAALIENWRLHHAFNTIFLGPFIYVYSKNYLEEYVQIDKF